MRQGLLFSIIVSTILCAPVRGVGGDMGLSTEPLTDGSSTYPYLIEDLDDFKKFADNSSYWANEVHTKLMTNIDLAGKTYTRAIIAKDTSTNSGFQGTAFGGNFDGNGYVVSNSVINTAGENKDYLGLFGQIDSSGEVNRLGLTNVSIKGGDYSHYVGGLCGANFGSITLCHVTGSISGFRYVGGLCGRNSGKGGNEAFSVGAIKSSYADCSITAIATSGGLCGLNANIGVIEDSYATGFVAGGEYSNELGGLCGRNGNGINYGEIRNSFALATVTGGGYSTSLGGLCGSNDYSGITNCYSTGNISGGANSSKIGGLCGEINEGGSIVNCYCTGKVTGQGYIGGFCGYNQNGIYVGCFWDIETSGTARGVEYLAAKTGTVIGKTTSQMRMQSTFIEKSWNFEDIWWIREGKSYPRLRWEFTNAKPVADAGADKMVYASLDGYALVQLDGMGSTDADGDTLTYSWYNDANELIATGAEPNVLFGIGEYEITLIVNDGTEDSLPDSCVITVVDPFEALAGDITELVQDGGIANSLLAKVDAALKILEDGNANNDGAAAGSLGGFINAVNAQRGKKISEADADALIAAAQRIIDML